MTCSKCEFTIAKSMFFNDEHNLCPFCIHKDLEIMRLISINSYDIYEERPKWCPKNKGTEELRNG